MFAPRSLLLSVSLVVSACSVGEVPASGSSPTVDGGASVTVGSEAGFTANIAPMLSTRGCSTTCHGAAIAPNFTSYATLAAKYKTSPAASNILITKAADGGTHNGATYLTAADKATITTWINAGGG